MQKTATLLCAALSVIAGLGCTATVGSSGGAAAGGPSPDGGTPPAGVSVLVSPAAAYPVLNAPVAFSAVVSGVTGSQPTTVTWSVQESGGGVVDGTGKYTAPGTAGAYHVVATSVADPTRSGTALVTVGTNPVISADRLTLWNPGLNAVGGIPNQTTVYKTLSPSGGDDTQAIQAALDACPANQVVVLNAGTFNISGQGLQMTKSNVVLRGAGPTATFLNKKPGTSYPVISIGIQFYDYTTPIALSADSAKGTSSITLASNPGYKVGEIVVIDQLSDETRSNTVPPLRTVDWGVNAPLGDVSRTWFCEENRPVGQVLEIASISGNTLTFTTPLHATFEVALTAHLVRLSDSSGGKQTDAVKYSGIEDLAVTYGEGGDGGGNIHLFATAYCWVKNIESSNSNGHSVNLDGAFRSEVRDSYLHTTVDPNPGGAGYGIGVNQYASDNLYENNVVWNFNKVTVGRASGGGNVFGYNYLTDGYGAGYTTYVEDGLSASHYTGAHMELFEGNEAFNFDNEVYWGNSTYGMVFRNHFTGLRRSASPLVLVDTDNRRAVGLQTSAWWFSFVGNVLGFPGMALMPGQDKFIANADPNNLNADDGAVYMWQIGYEEGTFPDKADPLVVARTYQDGNYDYVSNAVSWDPSDPNHTVPPSLYLTSKPAFFGANPWPWVEATGSSDSARLGILPARVRFDADHTSTYPTYP
jgi:hypothetical protein